MALLTKRRWRRFLRTRSRRWWTVAAASALGVVVISVIVVATRPVTSLQAKPLPLTSAKGVVTRSASSLSTQRLTPANYHSTATGTEPAYIRLPSIGAAGYVQKVGVDQNQQMAVPTNIHLAGWYVNSVLPGQLGLSIINGHIDGPANPGIFEHLARLKAGDTFEIDLANGTKQTYLVKQVQSLPLAQVPAVLFSQMPGIARQLNLITCTGAYSSKLKTYNQRVVVISSFVRDL